MKSLKLRRLRHL